MSNENTPSPQPEGEAHAIDPRQLANMFLDAYNEGRYASPEAARQAYEHARRQVGGEMPFTDAVMGNVQSARDYDQALVKKQNIPDSPQAGTNDNRRTGIDTMERQA